MDEIEDAFETVVAGVKFARPHIKLISSVTGRAIEPDQMADPGYYADRSAGRYGSSRQSNL